MRKWLPLVAICAGTFMLLVDVTIVNVALPDMARSLHTTFSDLQWVIDIYALVLAALVLTAGSVADRIGRRTVYLAGLVLFAASSAASGAATSAAMLIAARGVQGLGAAMMFATTIALLSNSYQGRDRGVAFGAWGATNGAAAAAGPILGGLLTTHVGWRWIFYVNLPVSVIAVAMTALVITESRDPAARRIDLHRGRRLPDLRADPRRLVVTGHPGVAGLRDRHARVVRGDRAEAAGSDAGPVPAAKPRV
jgi:MFS family permease